MTTTTTSPEVTPSGAPTPTFVPGDDTNCAGSVDAIEVAVDGNVYAFRLALVYKLNNDGVEPGWPKLLSEVRVSSNATQLEQSRFRYRTISSTDLIMRTTS